MENGWENKQVPAKGLAEKRSSESRRGVRWLLFLAVAVVAGIIAFCSSRAFRPDGLVPKSDEPRVEEQSSAADIPAPVSADPFGGDKTHGTSAGFVPDPAAPRPMTTEALVEELNKVTAHLLESIPDHPDSLEIMARVQYWLGNTDEAVKLWESCLRLDPRYGHAYFGMGLVAAKKGEYEAAAAFFRKSLLLAPTSTETQVALGEALINAGRMEEAIAVLDQAVGPDSLSAKRAALLGQAYLHLQDFEKAREHYQAAIGINPYSADTYYGLATACARLGQSSKATEFMGRFKELRTGEREARQDGKRNYDDLEASCQEVAKKYTDVGRLFFSHGDLQQAERLWQRAATLAPGDVDCRQALAWRYRRSGRTKEAIGVLKQLAEIEQGGIHYDLEIGRLYAELGDFKAAEEAFLRVREVAPRLPDGCTALARLYLDAKLKAAEVAVLAREAVALDPSGPNYALLSEACEFNGDRAGAFAAIQSAMAADPDNSHYRRKHEKMKAEQ